MGVDHVEIMPFTRDFSELTTEDYLCMLMERFGAKTVLVGYDNRMGSDADGSDQVARKAESLGLEGIRTDMVTSELGYAVSSTKIRERLEE